MATAVDHNWLNEALVMIMTLRESDAGTWDAEEMAEFAKSFSLDALGFSVGGIMAFYPTDVPFHTRSSALGDRDLVAEMIASLEKRGIRPIARIDPSMASRELYSERPEWFVQDKNGLPVEVHGHFVTCPNGGYYHDFMIRVIEEMLTRYPFDGLWANAAQFSPWHTPQCHCATCQSKFRVKYGKAIPDEDWGSETWRQYNEWRYECIAEWNREVQAAKNRLRPQCAWMPLSQVAESWDHSRVGGWDLDYTEPYQDGIVLEAQRRYTNMFWPGLEARYMRGLAPGKGGGITVSYFLPWWRFYSVPAAENRMWAGQIMAQGVMPWLHVTGYQKQNFDTRGLEAMRELFALFRKNRVTYAGTPAADVALVYSRHSLDNFGHKDPAERYLDHFRGAYNAMMDQRIPFDILSGHRLTLEALKKYRAIVLPNAACLSDTACAMIEAYVRDGGHLVTTYLTGDFDETGKVREEPLLARLAGAKQTGVTWKSVRAAYAAIRSPEHPLLSGFTGTDLLPVAGDITFLRTAENDGAVAPLTLVPPVEGEVGSGISVPEFNKIDHVTDYPMVIDRKVGKGRLVHFPWQPDLIGFRYGLRDLFRLLANAVRISGGWQDAVRLSGPGLVDVTVLRQADRLAVSIVNFSAPGSFATGQRRIIEELMPLRDLELEIRVPETHAGTEVRLVFAGQTLPAERKGDYLRLKIPRIDAMETVEVMLA